MTERAGGLAGLVGEWREYVLAKESNGEFAESTKRHMTTLQPYIEELERLVVEWRKSYQGVTGGYCADQLDRILHGEHQP